MFGMLPFQQLKFWFHYPSSLISQLRGQRDTCIWNSGHRHLLLLAPNQKFQCLMQCEEERHP